MTRESEISKNVYRRHIRLYRYLNDTWIFTLLMRPVLKQTGDQYRESGSRKKRNYVVPKRDTTVISRRTDEDISGIMLAQYHRGVFESNIVTIVSRLEAFIQECVMIAVMEYPQKLALLGEKSGVPLGVFLAHNQYDDVLREFTRMRCEALMFGVPKDYLVSAANVLSISLKEDLLNDYVEMKASRDIIVHGSGVINDVYRKKAGAQARGSTGEELAIDRAYFKHVIVRAKMLSGSIASKVEEKYG